MDKNFLLKGQEIQTCQAAGEMTFKLPQGLEEEHSNLGSMTNILPRSNFQGNINVWIELPGSDIIIRWQAVEQQEIKRFGPELQLVAAVNIEELQDCIDPMLQCGNFFGPRLS